MERIGTMKKIGISGSALKIIAIITMFIDHFGFVILENGLMPTNSREALFSFIQTDYGRGIYTLDLILRTIGRIAFPIFAFLLVEGFLHTRNKKAYGKRLFLFALISEIPFDLAGFHTWFYPGYQNIFFTLFLGILVLWGLEKFQGAPLAQVGIFFCGALAAFLLKTDYSYRGIMMISIFYVFRNQKKLQLFCAGLLALLTSFFYWGFAVFALIPIYFYNGEKGTLQNKQFFYWFYPVHLFLLFLIRIAFIPNSF